MKKNTNSPQTIEDYIKAFPDHIQKKLREIRVIIQKEAPQAEEKISYGIPTFALNGNLVHFGGYDKHIGFYPGASGIAAFQKELSNYKTSKGTIQFSLEEALPAKLIQKIVRFRIQENQDKKKK